MRRRTPYRCIARTKLYLLEPGKSETFGLVVEKGCKYFAEKRFPDMIHARLRISRIGSSSVRFEIGLFRNDKPAASAKGGFVHVYVDRTNSRLTPIDGSRRAAFDALML